MKNLLTKTLTPFTIYAFIVLAASIPVYFFLVDWIWINELDENNQLIAQRVEIEFNEQKINTEKLKESIDFWNEIQPGTHIDYIEKPLAKDSTYSIYRQNPYYEKFGGDKVNRFRGYITTIQINDQHFALTVETNVEETEETVGYIAVVTLLFFIVLVLGFWLMNKRLSKQIWKPFHRTLDRLKDFQLNNQKQLTFEKTDIKEFHELHVALEKLISQSLRTYQSQKEFTENASHELQTPLAILKQKLDLFLQDKQLTEEQYTLVEDMQYSLSRAARLNKNLLLLTKIENEQFQTKKPIDPGPIVEETIDMFQDFIEGKVLQIQFDIQGIPAIKGDSYLFEILIQNLLINAIRHAQPSSTIVIILNETTLSVSNGGTQALDDKQLFKRFAKQHDNRQGAGLGLAIAYEICQYNHWQLSYTYSQKRHQFTITFFPQII
ncbi:sensor histidine kinase [Sphingobacterium psychroaquaticum]|uniref:histidine kinase n=1 Tax=Sphingobacterium psychroaquaticum TaxID=561061 RepID=A0A1X7JUV5_9SPHI|nr:HAMP domain-containing sensor histidine kinase [Sphingobacterium psychroaquaticum]SMG31485.1 Signal transduction histidine kinase [Sphingobacterium psychroaquaticum]